MNEPSKTLLIIDDEEIVRESFTYYFEDRLWQCIGAESGEKALAIMDDTPAHCAIVDIRMGGMDGNAFIRAAYLKNPKMVCIICTGSPEYDIPADLRAMPNVSNRVFGKPVTAMAELEGEFLGLLKRNEIEGN